MQFKIFMIFIALSCLTGCATTQGSDELEADRTSLVVVEVEGEVQMSWNSSIGRSYTILYSDMPNPRADQWNPLSNHTNMRGTGRTMTARDRLPPNVPRQYRLRSNSL